jgi:hypothetical protein
MSLLYHMVCHMDMADDLDDCYMDEESLIVLPDEEWDNVGQLEKTRYVLSGTMLVVSWRRPGMF